MGILKTSYMAAAGCRCSPLLRSVDSRKLVVQVAEIIEHGIRDHPDLAVGAGAERAGVRSVGNSQVSLQLLSATSAATLVAVDQPGMKQPQCRTHTALSCLSSGPLPEMAQSSKALVTCRL